MNICIVLLAVCFLAYLLLEARRARQDRAKLRHIVHVNGIRGKSSTSRLIAAGLSGGGLRTFCKTTGTDPMTIDVNGRAEVIRRPGCSNIREQLTTLHKAALQNADVLVVECMAVRPDLQAVCQDRMLKADIGVITNVRRDHTDVMGDTLSEIGRSLSNTVPENGVLFTAEHENAAPIQNRCKERNCAFVQTSPRGDEPDSIPFPENVALALAVCESLGVSRQDALAGMCHYQPDPYALSVHPAGPRLFVNALSANDIQSTLSIWEDMLARYGQQYPNHVLLLNCRADRGARTEDMLEMALQLRPHSLLLMGAQQNYLRRRLLRKLPELNIGCCKKGAVLDLSRLPEGTLLFAAGNLAGDGRMLIRAMQEEEAAYV